MQFLCWSPLCLKPCTGWAFNQNKESWYIFTKNQQSQQPRRTPLTMYLYDQKSEMVLSGGA